MGKGILILRRFLLFLNTVVNRISAFLSFDNGLHRARFARMDELRMLLCPTPEVMGLFMGMHQNRHLVIVQPTKQRRELGNLLIVGPTRSGKGLLATSQLLLWPHSVVVNDIKGELFAATAGYRRTLGEVFVIDPTGLGHSYDPMLGKTTEDALFSA